jgi:hypothetical protein
MNNTTKKTRTTPAIVAILTAATLVVGTFATTTVTQSAYAYTKKGGDNGKEGNGNSNTITIQKCKQAAIQSGFDNNQGQECENLICTHPGENATCVQEGAAAVTPTTTPPVKKTCEQCFTSLLSQSQINSVISQINSAGIGLDIDSLAELCADLQANRIGEGVFVSALSASGVTQATITDLFTCLRQAGILFE